MPRLNHSLRSILLLDQEFDLALPPTVKHVQQSPRSNLITRGESIVVIFISKGQRYDTLFLEVSFVDAGKRFGEDDAAAEVAGLEGSVFAGRAFAVVVFCDDEPLDALVAPFFGEVRDAGGVTVGVVGGVDFVGLGVDGADERVFADVGEVAFVFEPGAGRGDGVGRALAFDFVEDAEVAEFGVGEGGEGVEKSQAG